MYAASVNECVSKVLVCEVPFIKEVKAVARKAHKMAYWVCSFSFFLCHGFMLNRALRLGIRWKTVIRIASAGGVTDGELFGEQLKIVGFHFMNTIQ